MLQEGNASRERLNEFNDLIYCFILYTVYTRGAKTDVRPYNFFLVRHKSRTKLKLYGIIYGCPAIQKDVRLRKNDM